MDRIKESIAERVARAWESPSPEALEAARFALVDTVAVGSAGYHLEPVARRYALEHLLSSPAGPVRAWGAWRGTGPRTGAVVNSFLSHSIEYDDWLRPGYVHAGAVVVPVAVSAAQSQCISLEEVLRAVVAGYEAAGLVGAYLGGSHYRVYHSTATAGAAGASTTYYLLATGSSEGVSDAIAAALNYAGGLWDAPRDPRVKPYSASHAAQLGVDSAILASAVRPVRARLEEACKRLGGECRDEAVESPGWRLAVLENGFKLYPTCRHTHTVIDAVLEVREEVVDPGRIREVTVRVYEAAKRVASRWPVDNRYDARFSIEYLTALTLLHGSPTISKIDEGLRDKDVLRLASKVHVIHDPLLDREYPERMPAVVEIAADAGKIRAVKEVPRGDPGTVVLEVILEKARTLSKEAGDARVEALARAIAGAGLEDAFNDIFSKALGEY